MSTFIEVLMGIGIIVVPILLLWLLFFKIIPHLIYVIRKAWLKAAQDAKSK